MRRTKIVATIGPASRDPETLARMVEAGVDVARLNFSHGDSRAARRERRARARRLGAAGRQVAILQDLPGPKLRIGALQDDIAELKPGEKPGAGLWLDRRGQRRAHVGALGRPGTRRSTPRT